MSYRKETKARNYYAWVGHRTRKAAEKEAEEYRSKGQKCKVAYDKKTKAWWVWRWHDKKNPAKQKKSKASEDTRQRRKYARGGRIEAYTMGEAAGGKGFPW